VNGRDSVGSRQDLQSVRSRTGALCQHTRFLERGVDKGNEVGTGGWIKFRLVLALGSRENSRSTS